MLVLSAAYWLLNWALWTSLGLRLARVPVVVSAVLLLGWPVWLLGLGFRRWPRIVMVALGIVAAGVLYVGGLAMLLSGSTDAPTPVAAVLDGRPVHLFQDRDVFVMSLCYDLHVALADGWLRQPLGLPTCVDHGRNSSYDPDTVIAEAGPVAHTLAITAEGRADQDSAPQRKRVGLYRIGFGGRLVSVVPSSATP